MARDEVLTRVGVFAVVFLAVVGVAVAVPGGGSGQPAVADRPPSTFTSPETVADLPAESGTIEMDASAAGEVVVIDAGHGASIDREQLEPLVRTLTEKGATVEFSAADQRDSAGFNASLRRADAFVAFGAERRYSQGEMAALERFEAAGGRLLLVEEPERSSPYFGFLVAPRRSGGAVPTPTTELASRFGIAVGNGYLYDMHEYDSNYRNVYASPTGEDGLVAGVDRLVLHEAVPVTGPETVVQTTETAELSETREQRRYAVVVRSGNVVAVGDSSVLGQDFYRRADNEVFVGNLLDYLVSGEKRPENAPQPTEDEEDRRPRPRPAP